MWDTFEEIASKHQFTIQAITAAGTLAAVFVSVIVAWLAVREARPRLRAYMSISSIYHQLIPENGPRPTYVTVDVTNNGNVAIHVPFSFCMMKFRFRRRGFVINPLDAYRADEWVPQIVYPFEVVPGKSHAFFVSDLASFKDSMALTLEPKTWRDRLTFWTISPRITLSDGRRFKIKVSDDVQKLFDEARKLPLAERQQAFERVNNRREQEHRLGRLPQ